MISPTAAGRITSDVVATERLVPRVEPTNSAAKMARTAAIARMTSLTAIASQADSSCPATEYHGRDSATSISTPATAASQSPQLRRRVSTLGRLTDGRGAARLEAGRLERVHEQHR